MRRRGQNLLWAGTSATALIVMAWAASSPTARSQELASASASIDLFNPPPLLMGYVGQAIEPFSELRIAINYRPGIYEDVDSYQPRRAGDVSLNNRVTSYDGYFFKACMTQPGVPYRAVLEGADRTRMAVACWLCDLDRDGDVDQADANAFASIPKDQSFVWGDADRDGRLSRQDVGFVIACTSGSAFPGQGDPCLGADLNESWGVDRRDVALAVQAVNSIINGFERCARGPSVASTPECAQYDYDLDGDVDQNDFGLLQQSLN